MSQIVEIEIPVELQQVINADLAYHFEIVPKAITDESLEFYIGKGEITTEALEELELYLGKEIAFTEVDKKVLVKALHATTEEMTLNQKPVLI